MSQGFSNWSNNDNSDLNIRAVRFGFNKPILETELNEMQDLSYLSTLNSNKVNYKPHTYISNDNISLGWEYVDDGDNVNAFLVLKATNENDMIKLVFSGGIDFYYSPEPGTVERQILAQVVLPKGAPKGTVSTLISKAFLKTLSPDPSDMDYSDKVAYAVDNRYPALVSTKRIVIDSGFDEEHTELLGEESYEKLLKDSYGISINSLNSGEKSIIILGSWEKTSDEQTLSSWKPVYEIQRDVRGLDSLKYALLTNGVDTYGAYSVTPLIQDGTCEIRLDFPFKSIRYGYYALRIDDKLVTEAMPINHPLRTTNIVMNNDRVTLALYDLREITVDEDMWGNYTGQSWEDLLNQKWFFVDDYSTPSLVMRFNELAKVGDVGFGSLIFLS